MWMPNLPNSTLNTMSRSLFISASLLFSGFSIMIAPGVGLSRSIDFNTFFQEGQPRSQDTLILTPKQKPALPVTPNSQFWQYLVFRSAGLSLWMPPGTLSEENIVLNTASGSINFRAIAANAKDGRYVAGYAPNLTPTQLADPDKLFKAISEQISAGKFATKQNRALTWQERSGREVMLQSNSETIVFRVFLSEQKAYALGVRYPGLKPPSREVNGYLSSFQFL